MNLTPRSRYRAQLRACLVALSVSLVFPLAQTSFALDGTWILDGAGTWDPAAPGTTLWSGNIVAQGTDFTADFSTLDITGNRAISLGAPVTIGNLKFGDMSGSQTWTLSGANTLTLDTTTGTAPTITVNNNTATISTALAGSDGLIKAGAGRLVLSGGHAFTGTIEVGAGTLDLWETTSAYTNNINLSAASATLDAANTASSTVITISGNITGSGRITKSGSVSTMVLTGNNDYTGGTTLSAGTLVAGSGTNNGLGSGTLTLSGGALRSLDNASRTFANAISMGSNALRLGGLQGDSTGLGDLNFTWTGSTSIGGSKTWTVNNTTKVTFSNNWSGNNGWNVTKAGTGTLVFSGNLTSGVGLVVSAGTMVLNGGTNSYTGATAINGGTLLVGGSITNSVITVNAGGRIGGTGSAGNVNFSTGAGLAYEVATAAQGGDGLTTAGFSGTGVGSFTIYLSGAATGFNDASNYSWAVLSSNSTDIAGIVLSNLTLDTSGFGQAYTGSFSLSKDAGSIYVNYTATAVPEPSTYALLAGGILLGFATLRRRR